MSGSHAATEPAAAGPAPAGPIAIVGALGFFAGLPYALNGSTLAAWLTDAGVDLSRIGLLSLCQLPYSLKVLWAPLLDRYAPPWFSRLGRRRGFILWFQLAVAVTLGAMGLTSPAPPGRLAALGLLLGLFAASQDIVVDAHRSDSLLPAQRSRGAAAYVMGYRVAMITSGALALILADRCKSFRVVYLLMAALAATGPLFTLLASEPSATTDPAPATLHQAVVAPWREFFQRPGALRCLLFLSCYRLPDTAAAVLIVPFLLSLGYSKSEIGAVQKGIGIAATIAGALLGGRLTIRLGIWRALSWFGALQAVGLLGYLGLSLLPESLRSLPVTGHGPGLAALLVAVAMENLGAGLAIAAAGAFLLSLCDRRYSATQFALLTGAIGLGGRVVGAGAGYVAARLGFPGFFLLVIGLSVPALCLLPGLRRVLCVA